jgi:hypothetical protein
VTDFGRAFYKTVDKGGKWPKRPTRAVSLEKGPSIVVATEIGQGESVVDSFLAGDQLWNLSWKSHHSQSCRHSISLSME